MRSGWLVMGVVLAVLAGCGGGEPEGGQAAAAPQAAPKRPENAVTRYTDEVNAVYDTARESREQQEQLTR